MKRKSFIKELSKLIRIQIVAMIILMVLALIGTYRLAESRMRTASENYLEIYGNQLENSLERIDRVLGSILYENESLHLIQSTDYLTRHYAAIELQRDIADMLRAGDGGELVIIAESTYDISLLEGKSVPFEERTELIDNAMHCARNASGLTGGWDMIWVGESAYLCRSAVRMGRAVMVYQPLDEFMDIVKIDETSNQIFFWTDTDGTIFGKTGYSLEYEWKGVRITDLPDTNTMVSDYEFLGGQFRLVSYESKNDIFKQMSGEMFVMIVAALLLYFFTLHLLKSVRTGLIVPMRILTDHMKDIQQGNYELRMEETSGNKEFYMLAVSFNQLLDEIIHLKIQDYEKRLRLQEADQKYIRLQLRPHFFLNAMATVSSLSAKNKNKEIQIFIDALSKNIRYIFSSGMHTVSIKDEIRHVQNYLEMQDLRYPDCVFSYIELPSKLEDWRVPQMMMHTLVENEYRYAVSRKGILALLIKISEVCYENENMLLIEVEDDGDGYPEDVMNYINEDSKKPSEDGTRVGLWSLKRLMELMYDRKGLFRIDNIKPHGAFSRIYIPKVPVHEVRDDKPMDSGIE